MFFIVLAVSSLVVFLLKCMSCIFANHHAKSQMAKGGLLFFFFFSRLFNTSFLCILMNIFTSQATLHLVWQPSFQPRSWLVYLEMSFHVQYLSTLWYRETSVSLTYPTKPVMERGAYYYWVGLLFQDATLSVYGFFYWNEIECSCSCFMALMWILHLCILLSEADHHANVDRSRETISATI